MLDTDNQLLDDMLDLAVRSAQTVSQRVGEIVNSTTPFEVRYKGDVNVDIVTEMDVWAEDEIRKRVLAKFPNHTIIGEEASSSLMGSSARSLAEVLSRGTAWVIDPIDGTVNFANRVPHVSVSIGILIDGQRKAAVVCDPMRNETFTAIKGRGAHLNGKAIRPSQKSDLVQCLIATGFPYDRAQHWKRYFPAFERVILRARDLRRFGCSSVDQCWVACGRLDAYFEYGLKPWDIAAASLIVEEAGGAVANFAGEKSKDLDLTRDSYVAANAQVFAELLSLLEER